MVGMRANLAWMLMCGALFVLVVLADACLGVLRGSGQRSLPPSLPR